MSDRVLRYCPRSQGKNGVAGKIYGTDRDLLDMAWASAAAIFGRNFIKTADAAGVRRFEKMLNLSVDGNGTLGDRRQAVIKKQTYRPPFTRQTMAELLELL